jgi:DNA gyrase/topoisomerase IV subunit B
MADNLAQPVWHADAYKQAWLHRATLTRSDSMLQEFRQSFERGLPISDMQQQPQPAGDGKASGTTVRFLYDKSIFTPG